LSCGIVAIKTTWASSLVPFGSGDSSLLADVTVIAVDYGDSVGLMGSFYTGSWIGRNDDIIILDGDVNAFGAEWQVREDEPMLFQTVRAPQYPALCNMPPAPEQAVRRRGRRLGESAVSKGQAEEACARWEDNQVKEECISDVLAAGDLDLAEDMAY
jgi:hypothetical protein